MKKLLMILIAAALAIGIATVGIAAATGGDVIQPDGNGNVTLEVKLHLIGDINGDGKVNVTDVGLANAHAKKTKLLTDNYKYECADVNNDGNVNITDVGKINAHAKKTKMLW